MQQAWRCLAFTAGAADAYLPEGETFRERAGSVASFDHGRRRERSAAVAIKAALGVAPPKEAFLDKRDRAAMVEFYSERDFQPVWIKDGRLTPAAIAVIARIGAAAEDGLDPAAYKRRPIRRSAAPRRSGPELAAAVELTLDPRCCSPARRPMPAGWSRPRSASSSPSNRCCPIRSRFSRSASAARMPHGGGRRLQPPHEGYKRLKAVLAELRAKSPRPKRRRRSPKAS